MGYNDDMPNIPDLILSKYPNAYEVTLPESVTHLYVLVDPRSPNEVAYVGKCLNPHTRLSQHCAKSQRRQQSQKDVWVNDLVEQGLKPRMIVLTSVRTVDAVDAERGLIQEYKAKGQAPFNSRHMADDIAHRLHQRQYRKENEPR